MKKSSMGIVGLIIVIVIVGGAYAIFHKSKPVTRASSSSASNVATTSNAVLVTTASSSLGQYFSAPNGKALYVFGSDTNGVSNCTGSCLSAWPPYVDTGSTSNLPQNVSTIKRTDTGQIQYTYNGKPLYYFASDTGNQPTGNNVSGFTVAKPVGASATSSSQAAKGSSTTSSNGSSTSNNPY